MVVCTLQPRLPNPVKPTLVHLPCRGGTVEHLLHDLIR